MCNPFRFQLSAISYLPRTPEGRRPGARLSLRFREAHSLAANAAPRSPGRLSASIGNPTDRTISLPLSLCFVAGFLLDARAAGRQIARVEAHLAQRAFTAMNRLIDQLMQSLRRIGRGRHEVHPGSKANLAVDDREQGMRLRTELDDAPSSLGQRLAPMAQPAGPKSGRTRKAVLSKARRNAAPQNAMTFWGLAPVVSTDKSGDPAALAPASVLAGSSLLHHEPALASVKLDPPSGVLGGAIPFAATEEVAGQPSLLEPAPKLSPEEDQTGRPCWP
jgi:hypothetical protein